MIATDFEARLIQALQPVRGFALAQAVFVLMDSGIHDLLAADPGLSASTVAGKLGMDEARLGGFLRYLANEGFLACDGNADGDGWRLTSKARQTNEFRAWYKLLVGGYTSTFAQLGDTLRADAPYAGRNGGDVGAGSCGISAYDALPLAERLIGRLETDHTTVVDLGCGDAGFLAALCRSLPGVTGVGLEPDAGGFDLARARIEREGLADRVDLHQAGALDVVDLDLPAHGNLCFLTAFVLQEVLEQRGREPIVAMLRETVRRHPDAHWLVIEVDYRADEPSVMRHGLGLAYYNPYYLLHELTEQRLERREFWEELFHEAGLEVVAVGHPDDNVDSTGLEIGYLLRRAR